MASTRLQEDLLLEFQEEKKMIEQQLSLFEPLATSLRKPVATRLAQNGLILFLQLLCWLCVLAAIGTCFFLSKLYPFYLLFELSRPEFETALGRQDLQMLQWSVYGLLALVAILFAMLARSLSKIRKKNRVLSLAGKDIKTVLGQHLQRKAAIDAIEQRNITELPAKESSDNVNLIPNPGYDESEATSNEIHE